MRRGTPVSDVELGYSDRHFVQPPGADAVQLRFDLPEDDQYEAKRLYGSPNLETLYLSLFESLE